MGGFSNLNGWYRKSVHDLVIYLKIQAVPE